MKKTLFILLMVALLVFNTTTAFAAGIDDTDSVENPTGPTTDAGIDDTDSTPNPIITVTPCAGIDDTD